MKHALVNFAAQEFVNSFKDGWEIDKCSCMMAATKGTLVKRVSQTQDPIDEASESETYMTKAIAGREHSSQSDESLYKQIYKDLLPENRPHPDGPANHSRGAISTQHGARKEIANRLGPNVKQTPESMRTVGERARLTSQHGQKSSGDVYNHHHRHVSVPSCQLVNDTHQISPILKQHQPHCIHHNPLCQRHNPLKGINHAKHEHLSPAETGHKPGKYVKQHSDNSYLVVGYRPSRSKGALSSGARGELPGAQQMDSVRPASENRKSTTTRFISQLYFLIHLSAILTLLLHHKNLVTSERKPSQIMMIKYSNPDDFGSGSSRAPTMTSISNQLPEPSMVLPATGWRRFSRETLVERRQPASSDPLLRLLGPLEAKMALKYFLYYLLSTSNAIFICLRLSRICASNNGRDSKESAKQEAVNYGFYQRTRLDCTPVLVGYISLGLVQLIVIGMDIANKINWLDDNRWPTYLPFLQFGFVSLLMQYILGRVAKNHKRRRIVPATSWSRKSEGNQFALSIRDGNKYNNRHIGSNDWQTSSRSSGLQNIALAHLLVTHLLLWLMELNSISLFQNTSEPYGRFQSTTTVVHPKQSSADPDLTLERLPELPLDNSTTFRDKNSARNNETDWRNILRTKSPETGFEAPSMEPKSQPGVVPLDKPRDGAVELVLPEVKNERGLRSAVSVQKIPKPSEPTVTSGTSSSSSSIIISQSELMNLLNMAARNKDHGVLEKAATVDKTVYKSSLPKRMTAFRQSKPTLASTRSSSTTPSNRQTPKQQQHQTRVLSKTDTQSQSEDEDRKRRGKQGRQFQDMSLAGQQFPSIDRDPPGLSLVEERLGRDFKETVSLQNVIRSPKVTIPAPPVPSKNIKKAIETVKLPIPTTTTIQPGLEEEEEKNLDDDSDPDEPEVDLGSLLPPVPNYNDTSEVTTKQPSDSQLDEEAFVFNEAASEFINATVTPSKVEPEAMREARVLEAYTDHRGLSTFTDYLQPIVQQYHILVMAILFHLWLDSLYYSSQEVESGSKSSVAKKRHPLASSGSLSSVLGSQSSSTRGLIAIPIRSGQQAKARLLEARGSETKYSFEIPSMAVQNRRTGNGNCRRLPRSRSSESLCRQLDGTYSASLSRRNSLGSNSSEQLLWISSSQLRSYRARCSPREKRTDQSAYLSLRSASSNETISSLSLGRPKQRYRSWRPGHSLGAESGSGSRRELTSSEPGSSYCSVFLGLLVVLVSLLVILVGVDLLSILSQCLTQLLSIAVCLLGLCLIWRLRARGTTRPSRTETSAKTNGAGSAKASGERAGSHRQCFHYMFLLAAYFCGISIALNLGKEYSVQSLFSHQVVQFIEHHLSPVSQEVAPLSMANYLLLFHLVLAVRGITLLLQVTMQTVLIRSSCERASKELRQIYTFLMFANLSLWVIEICDQQQRHSRLLESDRANSSNTEHLEQMDDNLPLLTLSGFTRFASSLVTLSHLYHGLVFMQH